MLVHLCVAQSSQLHSGDKVLSLTRWDQGRSGVGERELESTGAFSGERQCSSNKVLQSKKAQNSSNSRGCYVLAFEQRLCASAVESW